MTYNLYFNFVADKKNNTMTITREFLANRQLVCDYYTSTDAFSNEAGYIKQDLPQA